MQKCSGAGRTCWLRRDSRNNLLSSVSWPVFLCQEKNIDLLRVCFADTEKGERTSPDAKTKNVELSIEEENQCLHFEQLLEDDFTIQKMAVRGHDKENRPVIVKLCRETKWSGDENADEGFQLAQFYIAERAIANAELRSVGKHGKVTAIFDFSSYDPGNAPPVKVMVETIKALQANYPERLGKAVVLDSPFWMQTLVQLVNPFLAPVTRDKLAVLGTSVLPKLWSKGPSSEQIREDTVRAIIDADQAMPFMLTDAKLTTAIDAHHQLRLVPFFELYDSAESALLAVESR